MALQLKIEANEQKNSFILEDCTGIYKYDNLTGWGVPNPEIRKITSSKISVWPVTLPLGSEPFVIDVTGDFPNQECVGIEIFPYQIGQQEQLISGKYKIKLEVTGLDRKGVQYTKTATTETVFINNVTCCIDKLQKSVNKDAKDSKKQQAIIELNNLIESANYAISCGLLNQASEIVELLKTQCVCVGC